MSLEGNLSKACFTPLDRRGRLETDKVIEVHFNRASLQYAITNTVENKGSGNSKKQYVTQSSAKLTMDLVFDTTDSGVDVRSITEKMGQFMTPQGSGRKKTPSIVLFEWGTYKFQGMMESFKETIDFFAPDGVPLRSSVNVTLASQDKVFESTDTSGRAATQGAFEEDAVQVPGQSASKVANKAGDPAAGRAVGAANGQDSLRFPSGASLTVDASVSLSGPVAFAAGGAGASLGSGGGLGISGGAGATLGSGGGLGIDVAAGAEIGASASGGIGGSASAGVSASGGAFSELHTEISSQRKLADLDTDSLITTKASAGLATDSDATFQVGGKASITGSTSLSADVGATASLSARLSFEED
jgi:hypothetical protein